MHILILYASTEGQTRKIARYCQRALAGAGHTTELLPAMDAGDLDLENTQAAILLGSVHVGKLQPELIAAARAHAGALATMPTLFLQVSLAAAGNDPDEHADLDRIARDMADQSGWQPGEVHQVAGAFRFTEYDFFKGWAMRYIARQKGQEVDPHTDTEFTDWAALDALMQRWPGSLPASA